MREEIYSDINLEKFLRSHFGVNLEIHKVIARELPVGRTSEAFIFMTKKKRMYVFISAEAKVLLGDIQKILAQMNLKADKFISPSGISNYFDDKARAKFLEVFPGRIKVSESDLRFYKTLVPYNPALVEISEVRGSEIKAFDADTHGNWRVAKRISFRKISTK